MPYVFIKAYYIIGMPEDTHATLQETHDMINELNSNETYITNVVPYPGTELYNQCIKDNLFTDTINPSTLWNDDTFYITNKNRFYLKPYKMDIEELLDWRKRFDTLTNNINIKNVTSK